MKLNKYILTALLAQSMVVSAFAENREADQRIFDGKPEASFTQVFLGAVDLIMAISVFPGNESLKATLKAAEQNLNYALDLPISESQRQASILAIYGDRDNFTGWERGQLKKEAMDRLTRAVNHPLVSEAEKTAAVAAAQNKVAAATYDSVHALRSMNALSKTVHYVRVGTSLVFVGDAIARLYIWNQQDADPTLSPVATYVYKSITK